MKPFYQITSLLFLLVFAFSEDVAMGQSMPWHPFPGAQLALFTHDSSAGSFDFGAVRIDSVRLEGLDSAYYPYRQCRSLNPMDTLVDCQGDLLSLYFPGAVVIDQDHFLGKKMLMRPDGDCAFIYSTGDTFLLKTQATLGQSWVWGNGLTAIVDAIQAMTVLGQPDSVKFVSISNGNRIQLSRANGLVQCYPFLPLIYPSGNLDTAAFYLWGLPRQGLGGHFPTFEEAYHYQVGDGWTGTFTEGNLAAPTLNSGWIHQWQVTSEIPGTHYQYVMRYESLRFTPFGYDMHFVDPADTLSFDSTGFDAYQELPHEWKPTNQVCLLGMFKNANYNGRMQYYRQSCQVYDSCSHAFLDWNQWSELSSVVSWQLFYHYFDGGDFNEQELNCFRFGNDVWGTCPNLQALHSDLATPISSWSVAPNPVKDMMIVTSGDNSTEREVMLLSPLGQVVFQQVLPIGEATITISTADLPDGTYFLRCIAGDDLSGHVIVVRH